MPEMMRKGANIALRLYIEGDDEPAHDYAQLATEIAKRVIALGIAAYQKEGPFQVDLTSVKVLEGSEGEEEEEAGAEGIEGTEGAEGTKRAEAGEHPS